LISYAKRQLIKINIGTNIGSNTTYTVLRYSREQNENRFSGFRVSTFHTVFYLWKMGVFCDFFFPTFLCAVSSFLTYFTYFVFHVFHIFHVFQVFHVFHVFHLFHVFHVFHVFHLFHVFQVFRFSGFAKFEAANCAELAVMIIGRSTL
jgi:hypothetical protein